MARDCLTNKMEVLLGEKFKTEMRNFPESDITKIREFMRHVKEHGLDNLPGRNKASDEVPSDDSDWRAKVQRPAT